MKKIISVPPNYFYACLVLCLPFYFIVKGLKFIPYPYTLTGVVLIILGFYLVIKPWYIFKKHNTPEDFSKSTFLVKEGLYKYSRNPMYIGGVVVLLGLAMTTGNAFSFINPVLFFLSMHFMFIPFEEEKMHKTFGEDYLEYKKTVRKWF